MTTTTRPAAALRTGHRLPLVLAVIAAVASLAAMGGGTIARLVLAIALPAAAGYLVNDIRRSRPSVVVLAVLGFLTVAASMHVVFTSPAAAWAVDGHMVPWVPLPSGSARMALAWSVPLLWLAVFTAVAVTAHRHLDTPLATPLLLGAGAAPLVIGHAFPTDAYVLLWDTTALGHLSYAIGACALLALAMLTRAIGADDSRLQR